MGLLQKRRKERLNNYKILRSNIRWHQLVTYIFHICCDNIAINLIRCKNTLYLSGLYCII